MKSRLCVAAILSLVLHPARIARAASPDGVAILDAYCVACHNPQILQGKLDLTTRESALRGGANGVVIVPGKSAESRLYQLASHQIPPFMPMGGVPLAPEQLKTLAEWIDAGAPWPTEPATPRAFTSASLFATVVKPLLEQRCITCHGAGGRKHAGLDLSSREALIEGGEDGPVINLKDPEASPLVARLRHTAKPGMPYNQPQLSADLINKVVGWIRDGAPYEEPIDAAKIPVGFAKPVPPLFKKLARPQLPELAKSVTAWCRNPVDMFLAATWQEKSLQPSPEADRRTLIRRVYFDLVGLPPTVAQVDAFLSDRSPKAYEKVVDGLLDSRQYGERWGRHWMDVWRYSDWYGNRLNHQVENGAPHIWRWRDWIIESLNADKGYDQMIREMIAGDEMAPNDPKILAATGLLVRDLFAANRNTWLKDTVDQISSSFLGMTLKCARCHDHKYDPITQEEYYRFRAFFEPYDVRLDPVPGQANVFEGGIARIFDGLPRDGQRQPIDIAPIYKDTFLFIRGDESSPAKRPLTPSIPGVLGKFDVQIVPVELNLEAHIPGLQGFVAQDRVAKAEQDVRDAEVGVESSTRWLAEARARLAAHSGKPLAIVKDRKPPAVFADLKPVLYNKCHRCHASGGGEGDAPASADLSVDDESSTIRGGLRYGPAIIPGNSAQSPLIRAIRGELGPKMPMDGEPVNAAQLAILTNWIDQMPAEDPAKTVRDAEFRLALARKHLEAVQLSVPSLRARLAADRAKYLQPEPKERVDELAKVAVKAERRYGAAQAAEAMLQAQQLLASDQSSAAKARLEVGAAALGRAAESYTPILTVYPTTSTGRRTALAKWISSRDNPVTARVAVNHIWMRHFGSPLVSTVSNFGNNGAKPTNQALLDWLSVEFMDQGWSMKKLHRLLVTSSAYRMISSGAGLSASNRQIDPDNMFYWRMNRHRMEAEVVRDTALYLAGTLDMSMSGPDIDDAQALYSRRRSIYLRESPENRVPFLQAFDAPEPTECPRRTETIIPQQALAAANSSLFEEAARLLTRSLVQRSPAEGDFIRSAFETVLDNPPTTDELRDSKKFLAAQTALFKQPAGTTPLSNVTFTRVAASLDPALRARENLVHVLLNYNEFITVR